ncbi:hypothetical protein LXL04_033659 [Taraxacum kok-saghyz]
MPILCYFNAKGANENSRKRHPKELQMVELLLRGQHPPPKMGPAKSQIPKNLQSLTVERLRALLKERSLSVKGKKMKFYRAMVLYSAQIGTNKRVKMNWINVACPRQPGITECGYYVLKFMKEVIQGGVEMLKNNASPIRSPSGNPKPLFHHPQSRHQLILLNRSGSPSTITPSHKSGPPLSNTNRTQKKHIATPRRRSTNRDLLPCRLYAADQSHQPVGISFHFDSRVSGIVSIIGCEKISYTDVDIDEVREDLASFVTIFVIKAPKWFTFQFITAAKR